MKLSEITKTIVHNPAPAAVHAPSQQRDSIESNSNIQENVQDSSAIVSTIDDTSSNHPILPHVEKSRILDPSTHITTATKLSCTQYLTPRFSESENSSTSSKSHSSLDENTKDHPSIPDKSNDSIDTTNSSPHNNNNANHIPCLSFNFLKMLGRFVGPGFLVAMAYIDPGNLAADINQGLAAGYSLAWVTLWCSIMGYIIQILAAKLGVTTDKDLAQHCRVQYPPFPRFILWAATELGIIACDMIEVIGGAAALYTLSSGKIPLWAGVLITATSGFATLCLERLGMRLLEAVLLILILIMGGTFGYMFFSTGVDYGQVAKGLVVPHLSASTISYAVGSIGAIIMPHNLYLHSSVVLTRRDLIRQTSAGEALRFVRLEAAIALLLALVINIFVIAVFAHTFYTTSGAGNAANDWNSDSPTLEVGLGNAGEQLAAVYGTAMRYIWGVGLFAAANASTVTSTYAGQVVMTGYLNMKVSVWWRTAIVRATTLGPTLLVTIWLRGENPSLSGLTEWLNIVQSLVLPFVVIPLLLLTSNGKVMGSYKNRPWFIGIMSLVVAFLVGMNGYMAVSFALDQLPDTPYVKAIFGIVFALYTLFVVYLLIGPRKVDPWVSERVKMVKEVVKGRKKTMERAVDMMEVHL